MVALEVGKIFVHTLTYLKRGFNSFGSECQPFLLGLFFFSFLFFSFYWHMSIDLPSKHTLHPSRITSTGLIPATLSR